MAREFQVRQVRSKEDRKRPSVFMSLKTDEQFVAHAMFEPDPELSDNPGYFEYYVHNDQSIKQYVPCAGEDCPFCKVNDNPWTRALTVWHHPDKPLAEQFKVFGVNNKTIDLLALEAEDEGTLLGRKLRVRRLSDKGDYSVRARPDKPIPAAQLKKLLPMVEELDLQGIVSRQLKAHMERLAAMEALEEDEEAGDEQEEQEQPQPRTPRGRAVPEEAEEEEEAEPEEEDDEDEEEEEDKKPEVEAEEDDEDEEEDEEEEDEEVPAVSGEFPLISYSEENETVTVRLNDKTTKMYVGEGTEVPYDDLGKGLVVALEAIQDDDEDWVITTFELVGSEPESDEEEEAAPRKRAARRAK